MLFPYVLVFSVPSRSSRMLRGPAYPTGHYVDPTGIMFVYTQVPKNALFYLFDLWGTGTAAYPHPSEFCLDFLIGLFLLKNASTMMLIPSRLAVEDMFVLMKKVFLYGNVAFFHGVYSSLRLQVCQMNWEDSDETVIKEKTLIRHNY